MERVSSEQLSLVSAAGNPIKEAFNNSLGVFFKLGPLNAVCFFTEQLGGKTLEELQDVYAASTALERKEKK